MSIAALNRIVILEEALKALALRVATLEARDALAAQIKSQACEERPHTLSLKKQKADSSHA